MTLDAVAAQLETTLPGRVERDASAAALTTYRLGGPIAVLARVATVGELLAVAAALEHAAVMPPMLVVGRGSNLLVADAGFPGLVVMLDGEFANIEILEDAVHAGSAVSLPVLARRVAAAGRTGLEFYVGIPGSVGGAVRMNAGGHGQETSNVLLRAGIVDLAAGGAAICVERTPAELDYRYRHSNVTSTSVVTHAVFATQPDAPEACAARLDEIVRWRRENQPGGANAGSVFQNPPEDSAGRLIEASGAKGLRIGGAVVSEKHANFIQAEAGATAQDVRDLVTAVRARVRDASGIDLHTEIRFIGFADGDDGEREGEQ